VGVVFKLGGSLPPLGGCKNITDWGFPCTKYKSGVHKLDLQKSVLHEWAMKMKKICNLLRNGCGNARVLEVRVANKEVRALKV